MGGHVGNIPKWVTHSCTKEIGCWLWKTLEICVLGCILVLLYLFLYNNQINAGALIGQSAVGYCAGKPTEKARVF